MQAAWYTKNGEAREVLIVGEQPTPTPGKGEVRVKLLTSGVNPSDVKSRKSRPIHDPLIIPHSDGAGIIDAVGAGVSPSKVGQRVWVWNGQWQRPCGTAAHYITLPEQQAVLLPDHIDTVTLREGFDAFSHIFSFVKNNLTASRLARMRGFGFRAHSANHLRTLQCQELRNVMPHDG